MMQPCPHCGGTGLIQDPVAVGQEFRALRVKAKLSAAEVARRIGVTPQYVCDLELGRRHWPHKQMEAYRMALKPTIHD